MISDKTNWVCVIAVSLAISGCSNSGGTNDIGTGSTPTAVVTDIPETSDAIASPVAAVSSAQMNAFIANPLVAEIPTELNGGTSTAKARTYVTNPLIN